jgi:hypothetical protein
MKRVFVAALLAGAMVGCASPGATLGEPVELLVGAPSAGEACSNVNWIEGQLVADPTYGTAVTSDFYSQRIVPVMWRRGYTGRRSGSEVAVLDPGGKVVAVTGHRYRMEGGSVGGNPDGGPPFSFWACGSVQ